MSRQNLCIEKLAENKFCRVETSILDELGILRMSKLQDQFCSTFWVSSRLSRILGTASWSISNEAFKHADWRLLKRFFIKIGKATTKTIFRRQRSRPTWRVPTAHVAWKRKSFSWSHCRFLWKIFLTNVNQHVKRLHLRYSTKVCLKFDST